MGEPDVDALINRLSSRLFLEWMAFYTLEPFGGNSQYIGHAITASTIANVNRGKGKKPYKMENFMPEFKPKKPQSVEEQIQFAAMFTAAMGGVIGGETE